MLILRDPNLDKIEIKSGWMRHCIDELRNAKCEVWILEPIMFVFFEELILIGSKIAFKTTTFHKSKFCWPTYFYRCRASNISFIFWNWRLDSLAKEFYFNMLSRFGKYLGLWQLDDRYFGGLFQFVFHDGIFEMIGNYSNSKNGNLLK